MKGPKRSGEPPEVDVPLPDETIEQLQNNLKNAIAYAGINTTAYGFIMEAAKSVTKDRGAVYLGDGRVRVGDDMICLTPSERIVVEALVDLEAATKEDLAKRTGYGAPTTLKRLKGKYPALAPFILLPGRKGAGGYRTTIRDGRK